MQDSCERTSPKTFDCVRDFVKVTPAKNLHKRKICFKNLFKPLNKLIFQICTVAICPTIVSVVKLVKKCYLVKL